MEGYNHDSQTAVVDRKATNPWWQKLIDWVAHRLSARGKSTHHDSSALLDRWRTREMMAFGRHGEERKVM